MFRSCWANQSRIPCCTLPKAPPNTAVDVGAAASTLLTLLCSMLSAWTSSSGTTLGSWLINSSTSATGLGESDKGFLAKSIGSSDGLSVDTGVDCSAFNSSSKLIGAVNSKAKIFLCPTKNYDEAISIARERNYDIIIKSVATFDEAVNYLKER